MKEITQKRCGKYVQGRLMKDPHDLRHSGTWLIILTLTVSYCDLVDGRK